MHRERVTNANCRSENEFEKKFEDTNRVTGTLVYSVDEMNWKLERRSPAGFEQSSA